MSKRFREYVFTVNNWTRDDREFIDERCLQYCVYLAYQPEIAPSTGTPHLQGYLCLTTPRTLKGVKCTVFDTPELQRVHLESARGTKEQCKEYCSKDESRDPDAGFGYCEFGRFEDVPESRGQGARNDIHGAAAIISRGGSMFEVASDFPDTFVRYHRGFGALQQTLHARPRVREQGGSFAIPRVVWYHGSTGSGKTHAVFEEIGDDAFYMKPSGNEWWDGYIGEDIVVLDDFRSNWFTFGYLLRLTDRYPMQVAVKGSFVNFAAKRIFITCPKSPTDLYADLESRHEGSVAQLTRRLSEVKRFGDEPDRPVAMIFNP